MSNFDFKKVLRENIEKREESNKNDKEDLNEFVGAFFKPKFSTNLASLKDPPEDDDEESEKEASLELEPGEFYVIKIGDKKDDVGYGRIAKGANISGDKIPVDRIQLTNVDKEMMDLSDKPEMLDRKAFIRKADKEDQKADQFKENQRTEQLNITEGILDKLKNFFATNKKPDNEKLAKIEKLVRTIESGNYRTNIPSNDVEDIFKLARQTLDRDNE
jgi:hypothetical protein